MLGKLIKNSMKANAAAVVNTYIALGVIGVVMAILMLIDWARFGERGVGVGLGIKAACAAALVLTAFICVILTFVSVFKDYHNTMFKREGQLTMTLPVKPAALLFAKWFSGCFWVLLAYVVMFFAAVGSFLYLLHHSKNIIEGSQAYYGIYNLVMEAVQQFSSAMGTTVKSPTVILNVASLVAISGGIKACCFVILAYFAITLSHCRPFHRLGGLGRLLYFFGGFAVAQIFSSLVNKLLHVYMVVSEEAFTFTVVEAEFEAAKARGFGGISVTEPYCTLLMCVAFFLVTVLLIDRKVNVDC